MLKENQVVRLRQEGAVSDYLPILLYEGIPKDCLWTPAARLETKGLGSPFGEVEIMIDEAQDG